MAAIASKANAPSADVLAAARPIVRALTPAGGRTNRRESADELRHRLGEDGAEIDKKYFNAAWPYWRRTGTLAVRRWPLARVAVPGCQARAQVA
jgi:hypothetical protein